MCFHKVSGHWKLRAGGDSCNGVDDGDKVENLEVKFEVMEGSIFFSESLWAWILSSTSLEVIPDRIPCSLIFVLSHVSLSISARLIREEAFSFFSLVESALISSRSYNAVAGGL